MIPCKHNFQIIYIFAVYCRLAYQSKTLSHNVCQCLPRSVRIWWPFSQYSHSKGWSYGQIRGGFYYYFTQAIIWFFSIQRWLCSHILYFQYLSSYGEVTWRSGIGSCFSELKLLLTVVWSSTVLSRQSIAVLMPPNKFGYMLKTLKKFTWILWRLLPFCPLFHTKKIN